MSDDESAGDGDEVRNDESAGNADEVRNDESAGNADEVSDDEPPLPFDGPVLLQAGATASVAPRRLPDLLREAQAELGGRLADYRREYERVAAGDGREVFLVDGDHWERVGTELGLDERERDAVRRAHTAQLERLGSETDRREEFETALEIREAAVIGRPDA